MEYFLPDPNLCACIMFMHTSFCVFLSMDLFYFLFFKLFILHVCFLHALVYSHEGLQFPEINKLNKNPPQGPNGFPLKINSTLVLVLRKYARNAESGNLPTTTVRAKRTSRRALHNEEVKMRGRFSDPTTSAQLGDEEMTARRSCLVAKLPSFTLHVIEAVSPEPLAVDGIQSKAPEFHALIC